jgi:ribosomal protein S27E
MRVEHPASRFVPVLGGLFHRKVEPEKRDRLLAQKAPLFLNGRTERPLQSLKDWSCPEVAHDLYPKSKYKYMQGFIDLAPVKCEHCGRAATLVKDWEYQNVRCPACGKPDLVPKSGWMT